MSTQAGEAPVSGGRRIRGLDASEREAQRRDHVLESALTLFAEQGYAHTSVEQVCAGANVSTKSFYRIFDNREDLYLEVYNRFRSSVFAKMHVVLEEASDDEAEAEAVMLDTLLAAYFDDPRCALAIQGPSRAISPTIELIRRDTRKVAARLLESVWRDSGLTGSYSGIAVAVIGGIFDLFTNALVEGRTLTEDELADLRVDVKRFYRAVRAGLTTAF